MTYTTARLMSRRYVNALLLHDEREIDIGGLWAITGFDQRPHPVHKLSRSDTTYTLGRKVALAVNAITSFSNAPLVGIFYLGAFIFVVAACFSAYVMVTWLFRDPLGGWTSLILSVWLLGGLIISVIGIIGIYLAKIFTESKRRPYTIVREIYGKRGSMERP
jgi:putative glycosyltransferase